MKSFVTVLILSMFIPAAFGQASQGRDQGSTTPPLSRRLGKIVGSLHLSPGEHQVPEMITVTLTTLSGSYVQHRTLNKELSFTFDNVAGGYYNLAVEASGYRTTEATIQVDHYLTGEQTFVTLTLGSRIPEDQALPPGSTATVRAANLRLDPKVRKELEEASRESQKGNAKGAIQHLEKAARLQPDAYEIYNNLAVEFSKLGRYDEAIRALEKSIELRADDPVSHRNLGQLYMGRGRFEGALPLLKRSLELDPANPRTYHILGQAYLALRAFPEAVTHLEEAARLDPTRVASLELGQAYLHLGKTSKAVRHLQAYLESTPQSPHAEQIRRVLSDLQRKQAAP